MTSFKLYAPLLLLSLTAACGSNGHTYKTEDQKRAHAVSPGVEKIVLNAATLSPSLFNRPVATADEAVSPAPSPEPGPAAVAPSAPATPTPATVSVHADAIHAPTPAAASPATAEVPRDDHSIKTGIKEVDDACVDTFKAIQAKDDAEFKAINLTVVSYTACHGKLIIAGVKLIHELEVGGFKLQLSATKYMDAKTYFVLQNTDSAYGAAIANFYDAELQDLKIHATAESNEKLDYLQASMDYITSKGPVTPGSEDAKALMLLKLSYDAQADVGAGLKVRINQIDQLASLSVLTGVVGMVGDALKAPPAAVPTASPAVEGTSPSTSTTGTTSGDSATGTNNGPETPTPQPEPVPAPAPVPSPEPAPVPTPVP
ncbi:MAG: hypothetical protein H7249_06360 [Chitinophagaceae bacterium]|nr:hypothetical protein [Oligoflexus sp.]